MVSEKQDPHKAERQETGTHNLRWSSSSYLAMPSNAAASCFLLPASQAFDDSNHQRYLYRYQYKIIGDHANSHNSYLSVRSCISTKTCSNCLNESSF
jgi:hypothetical protein